MTSSATERREQAGRVGLAVAGLALLLLALLPASAQATSAGLKPSEAPLISVGQHYFGNTYRETTGCCDTTDFWRLPSLLTSDAVTIAWSATPNYLPRLCLAQDVDDYSWDEEEKQCNGSEHYEVTASGSARSVIQVKSATSAAYLEFWGNVCCSSQSYNFTVESIQHAIGVGLAAVGQITPNSTLAGSANLSNGAPVPDGLVFALTAAWVTPVNEASHQRIYTSSSAGGGLTFPLNLPASAEGKPVSFTVSRPADPQYLAASSAAVEIPVARVTPPVHHHHHRRCPHGFKQRHVRGHVRCVRGHHRRHRRAAMIAPVGGLVKSADTAGADSPGLQRECLAAALAKPQITQKPTMHDAGVRVTSPHVVEQHVKGAFALAALPAGCAPDLERTMSEQLQMQNRHDRRKWTHLIAKTLVYVGNEATPITLFWAPTHPWPAWLFNECDKRHRWLKTRDVLTVALREPQTSTLVGKRSYPVPIPVYGSCRAANGH